MNELSKQVYDVLKNNDINKEKMLETLNLICKDFENSLWEVITVSPQLFYNLKDIVFYNLEHIPSGGEVSGVSNLRFLGTKFSNFIYCFNETNTVENENIPALLEEINAIIKEWNKDWKIVTLYTKSQNGWQGGENPSPLVIYNSRTESPSKYFNSHSNYGGIVDTSGNTIKKFDMDTVLCGIDAPIGEYVNGQIFYSMMLQFKKAAHNAIEYEKDLRIEFEKPQFTSW